MMSDTPTLQIQLFGAFSLQYGQEKIIALSSGKVQSLLPPVPKRYGLGCNKRFLPCLQDRSHSFFNKHERFLERFYNALFAILMLWVNELTPTYIRL